MDPKPMTNVIEPRLVVVTGVMSGEVFIVTGSDVSFGRDASNQICFPDAALSRRHCQFASESGRWIVRDLHSSNGTFVNGIPVPPQPLDYGDRISVGGSVLLFVANAPAGDL